MSIRFRLVVLCLLIALLPSVPLSLLVKSLLEKSFDVGLSETVEGALESGVVVSRKHLDRLHADFQAAVESAIASSRDGSDAAGSIPPGVDGVVVLTPLDPRNTASGNAESLPGVLRAYASSDSLAALLQRIGAVQQRRADGDIHYLESQDRGWQLALWQDRLFYHRNDPEFLEHANRLLAGRQIFAQLRLTQGKLSSSFFYPFIIVYAVILLLSLGLAFMMSERLSRPIRELARGAKVVAEGDWDYRLNVKAGGEVGRLVRAFNGMVARLDAQRLRLVDMERMATWRDMARHLAHEIKNPLLPIRLTVQELKDQYKGDDKQYADMLDESTRVIGDELNHLTKLVKEFSSFARMPDINPADGAVEPLVRDVARLYPQLHTGIECEEGLPDFRFDPDQIRLVLVNLFENSASVRASDVRVSVGKVGWDVVIMHSDNGPGIPRENIAKIFDPYFTTREDGTGLGLAMVKNIVLLHGGSVHVHSAGGKGTTFTIALPLAGPTGPAPGEKES